MGAGTPLTYVIGDIHGRLDLLTILLAQIEQHRAGRERTIVFLGDYMIEAPRAPACSRPFAGCKRANRAGSSA